MGSPHLSSPIQIVRTFRIETRKASKAVARRKVRPCSFLALGVPKGLTQRNEEFFFPVPLFLEVRCHWFTFFIGELRPRGVCTLALCWDPQSPGVGEVVSYSSWLPCQEEQSQELP